MHFLHQPQVRIVLIYIAVGTLWIWFSDRAIEAMFNSPAAITRAQNIKGWTFIIATAMMLYVLVRGHFQVLQQRHRELTESYDQTIRGWIRVMDLRHQETRDHSERVARMTRRFAAVAGLDKTQHEPIWRGALLHDIGKIGIPDRILTKPGALNDAEWDLMRRHPEIGRQILSEIAFLRPSADIPWCHHEKWDGSGYPRGLEGAEIPLAARMFAIIDVWDALSHDRVYKKAGPEPEVLEHIREQAGRHFDPELVDIFLDNYHEIRDAEAPGEAQNP